MELKERVKEANNLIKATVKQISKYEPESVLWSDDMAALSQLIKDQQQRIDELEAELKKNKLKINTRDKPKCKAMLKSWTHKPKRCTYSVSKNGLCARHLKAKQALSEAGEI